MNNNLELNPTTDLLVGYVLADINTPIDRPFDLLCAGIVDSDGCLDYVLLFESKYQANQYIQKSKQVACRFRSMMVTLDSLKSGVCKSANLAGIYLKGTGVVYNG